MMRFIALALGLFLVLSQANLAQAGQAAFPETQEAYDAEMDGLSWEGGAGNYPLPVSNTGLQLSDNYSLLRGAAARRFDFLLQGGIEDTTLEAYIFNDDEGTGIYFSYDNEGYVSLDDWDDIDSNALLEDMRASVEAGNEIRLENGAEPFYVVGWINRPTLDAEKNAVYWAIELSDGKGEPDSKFVNATALKLGRRGYETLIWVGSLEKFQGSSELVDIATDSLTFQEGFRFADFTTGDAVAAFGIASLVAVSASGGNSKLAKLGIFAAILAFGKKFIILPILLAFGAIGAFFRRFKNR